MSRRPTGPELGLAWALAGSSLACSIFAFVQMAIYLNTSARINADIAVVFSLLGLGLALVFFVYDPTRGK